MRTCQCKHKHVSGRRCSERVGKVSTECKAHKTGKCAECKAMMDAFRPKNGWGIHDGHY